MSWEILCESFLCEAPPCAGEEKSKRDGRLSSHRDAASLLQDAGGSFPDKAGVTTSSTAELFSGHKSIVKNFWRHEKVIVSENKKSFFLQDRDIFQRLRNLGWRGVVLDKGTPW